MTSECVAIHLYGAQPYLHDMDVLAREPAAQARLRQLVAAAGCLPHQRALHVHRLRPLQAGVPAPGCISRGELSHFTAEGLMQGGRNSQGVRASSQDVHASNCMSMS